MADIDRTWQDQLVPQVVAKARPVAELMTALRAAKDIDSACKTLGYRAQDENPCVFYVKVEGNISKIDSASRSGKMTIEDISGGNVVVQIGPTLRGTLLRDGYRAPAIRTLTIRCCLANIAGRLTNRRSK
jgi:predicted lipoprotein